MNANAITINLTHLKSIIGDDNEFVVEILEMIRLQSPEVVSTMAIQLEKKDYEALGATAHKYKSSINVLGNPVLSGIIRNIESVAGDASARTRLPDLVQEFRETCDALLKEIQNELDRLH